MDGAGWPLTTPRIGLRPPLALASDRPSHWPRWPQAPLLDARFFQWLVRTLGAVPSAGSAVVVTWDGEAVPRAAQYTGLPFWEVGARDGACGIGSAND